MSNCVNINSLEHLPAEQTLLVHYTITCTGTWYLGQLLTAYRNVCDTDWTVMYPNHQHPRHTDFPITVSNPGTPATFAWNYGGILGISAENFDEQHSYLTQLCLYNYECTNTGVDPTTGVSSGVVTGGETGTGGGGIIINPPFTPIKPPRIPPFNPTPIPVYIEPDPVTPGVLQFRPGVQQDPYSQWTGQNSGQPSGHTQYNTSVSQVNVSTNEFSSTSVSLVNLNQVIQPNTTTSIFRPSEVGGGSVSNPYLAFNPFSRSPAIPNSPGLAGGAVQTFSTIDPNTIEVSLEGSAPGTLSANIIEVGSTYQPSVGQVNIPSVDYSSHIGIYIPSTEITYGDPLVASVAFLPPVGVEIQGRIELYAQDSVGSRLIQTSASYIASNTVPLTCGVVVASSQFRLGQITITAKVLDTQDRVIAIKSILGVILEVNNTGLEQTSKVTIGEELPAIMRNSSTSKISNTPIVLDLPEDKSRHIVLEAATSQTKISAILVTKYNTQDSYQLTVHNKGLSDTDYINESDGTVINNPLLFFTTDKFKINNNVVYPHIHTVGFSDVSIPGIKYLILEVAPAINNIRGNTSGKLYLSENFKLRTVTCTVTNTSVVAKLPYIGHKVGLVIHGPVNGYVPETYSVIERITDTIGNVTWSGLTLSKGDYISIIKTENNVLNPFSTPIYTTKY